MAGFKTDGITTVVNLRFNFLSQNISTAADGQQYYPEWIFTTCGNFDTNTGIKAFWPQASERQAIFGIAALGAIYYLDGGARRRLGDWPKRPGSFEGPCDSNASVSVG